MKVQEMHEELILMRSQKGQGAAFDEFPLSPPQIRLLRLVNGYTPLGLLATRLDPEHDWNDVADKLIHQGLLVIERGEAIGT